VEETARPRRPGRGVQSVELLLDAAGDALVTGLWQRLVDAGLPSQGRHRSPSNRPHITVVAVPDLPPGAEAALAGVVAGRLPVLGTWAQLTRFGWGPWTLVWRVEPSPELLDLQARVAEVCAVPADQLTAPAHWTPHVTLARRVDEADLAAVREVLELPMAAAAGGRVVAPVLRRWDGAARREWPVGQKAEA
jgi:2'-5' RNA ligase